MTLTASQAATAVVGPTITLHEQIGFELGWDYAHHRSVPAAPYAQEPSPLRSGLLAGQATFGARTLEPTRHVQRWLQLRLHAWLRGRAVELVQVTPHFLQQIDVTHCPITRVALMPTGTGAQAASVDRVRSDAAYAAGNLAMMSTKANHAKASYGYRAALTFAQRVEAEGLDGMDGLTAEQWMRVAVLCSFVEPLPHEEAARVPLRVLPPNRLRLFNPAQALQAFISQQLLAPGWSHRLARIEDLVPGQDAKRAFQTFVHALLPRVLEAGKGMSEHATRWAVEDAWRNPLALQRWTAFVTQLTPVQCEALVARASAKKLGALRVQTHPDVQATDGWHLESRGYVPHATLMRRQPAAGMPPVRVPTQQHLPLH
jgi:hypothetical protein